MAPNDNHICYTPDDKSFFDSYELGNGILIAFNRIYQSTWPTFDERLQGYNSLTINICIDGRCDVSLGSGKYTIVTNNHLVISTISPDKDFYYPGNLYEGIALYFDMDRLCGAEGNFLEMFGLDLAAFKDYFCRKTGVYLQEISEAIRNTVRVLWNMKDDGDTGKYRFYMLQLLYELLELTPVSAPTTFFTKGQIAIVKKAEKIAMSDLSIRYPAKEFAEMFNISESSFKLYFKGIFGKGYLDYFREKRMEKAAQLLESTQLKVAEIALSVGYNNQGKFARVFQETYGVSPLEFRRLSK